MLLFIVDVNGFQLNERSKFRNAFETVMSLNKVSVQHSQGEWERLTIGQFVVELKINLAARDIRDAVFRNPVRWEPWINRQSVLR